MEPASSGGKVTVAGQAMPVMQTAGPDPTGVRVALWRAVHVLIDPPPHVFEDAIGLELAAPEGGWLLRRDMDPLATRPFRASIVARARFIEDLVEEQVDRGVGQYVILGAGLDSFAQRRPEIGSRIRIFEVDQPSHQTWKRQRLMECGYGMPEWLQLVPVDFEAGESWRKKAADNGFDGDRPALVVSAGVTMYLTLEANVASLREVAALVPGSTLVTTFLLPLEQADPEVRPGLEMAAKGAEASGTPFITFLRPEEMMALAREAGFRDVEHVSAEALAELYFLDRTDGLRPPRNAEELLVART
jgi:methyltransferase (TIGR00027 family)